MNLFLHICSTHTVLFYINFNYFWVRRVIAFQSVPEPQAYFIFIPSFILPQH